MNAKHRTRRTTQKTRDPEDERTANTLNREVREAESRHFNDNNTYSNWSINNLVAGAFYEF